MMDGVFGSWSPSTMHLILFALGGGLLYLGNEWRVPGATDFGIVVLGVLMTAAGLDMIIKKLASLRVDGWTRAAVVETYRGSLEVLWGIVFTCIGIVMLAVVLVNWLAPGAAGTFWQDLLTSPAGIGVVLAGVGLMMLLNGLIRGLAGSGTVDPKRLGGLPNLLDRLAGGVGFLLGAAVSAIGLMLLAAPGVVTATMEEIKHLVVGP